MNAESGALAAIILGFLLGLKHATDADHVVAVSTIVNQYRNAFRGIWVGASWGLGHTAPLIVIGLIILAFKGAVLDFYEDVTKQVADEALNGCSPAGGIYHNNSMYFAKDGTVWALMEYSLASVAQNALDAFKGPSEEALYNEFKASQAFKALDAEVEKPD